ncbi:hypothetical protein Tbd_0483 [Thiobacillus denitrificans ATCC 25259]|uniref:SnoaL-like domain-containing protein n=1 Tax=Thiobacillus denitrificans (strain ATCC 25259 / T1) TaxID=292415 RepID=Q3SLH4_THIDA|nr:nuclear transport factor 2 family protein [Thiobacillus denitrificans]AAZ96436.1 hypothetical protein Tbd_0483 [Thiobacillus denitrificans ATCC 25259]
MHPIAESISGSRYASLAAADAGTPLAALEQFYAAFNARDLGLMARNWARTDDIALDNPLGGIRRGWAEIQPLYERLFSGPARVYVEFHDYTLHAGPELFYAVRRGRGHFRCGGHEIALAIRTSRVFRDAGDGWKQVHHHGSIEAPVLPRYRAAVLGAQSGPGAVNGGRNGEG